MTARRGRPRGADVLRILQSISPTAAHQNHPPVLILLAGLPGSGKSTFSRRLAREINAAVLESDALRRLLFGEPTYEAGEGRRLFSALYAAAHELLEQGRNVIIDATSLRKADRQPAHEIAVTTGARLLILYFSAPEPIIRQRLAERARWNNPDDHSKADLTVYRQMATRQEPPDNADLTIDTSDAVATESALQRVVEACQPLTAGTARTGGGTH